MLLVDTANNSDTNSSSSSSRCDYTAEHSHARVVRQQHACHAAACTRMAMQHKHRHCHCSAATPQPHLLNTVMPGWSCSGMREPGGSWKMPMVMVGSSCMSRYVTVPLQQHHRQYTHQQHINANTVITR